MKDEMSDDDKRAKVAEWMRLRKDGTSAGKAADTLGLSQAVLYYWWQKLVRDNNEEKPRRARRTQPELVNIPIIETAESEVATQVNRFAIYTFEGDAESMKSALATVQNIIRG